MLSAVMSSAFQSDVVLHMHYHVGACMANVRPVFHQYIAGVISAGRRCQCQKRCVTWLKMEKNRKICGAVAVSRKQPKTV